MNSEYNNRQSQIYSNKSQGHSDDIRKKARLSKKISNKKLSSLDRFSLAMGKIVLNNLKVNTYVSAVYYNVERGF